MHIDGWNLRLRYLVFRRDECAFWPVVMNARGRSRRRLTIARTHLACPGRAFLARSDPGPAASLCRQGSDSGNANQKCGQQTKKAHGDHLSGSTEVLRTCYDGSTYDPT